MRTVQKMPTDPNGFVREIDIKVKWEDIKPIPYNSVSDFIANLNVEVIKEIGGNGAHFRRKEFIPFRINTDKYTGKSYEYENNMKTFFDDKDYMYICINSERPTWKKSVDGYCGIDLEIAESIKDYVRLVYIWGPHRDDCCNIKFTQCLPPF